MLYQKAILEYEFFKFEKLFNRDIKNPCCKTFQYKLELNAY